MNSQEIRDTVSASSELQAFQNLGDFQSIADNLPEKVGSSVSVQDVFDILFSTGDWSVIKQEYLKGNALAVLVTNILQDAKSLGSGSVNLDSEQTKDLITALFQSGLLSQVGVDALQTLRPKTPHSWAEVKKALEE